MFVERWTGTLQVQPRFRNKKCFYFRNTLLGLQVRKGGFPLIAKITRRQFLQQKFGTKTMAASIT